MECPEMLTTRSTFSTERLDPKGANASATSATD
jgi:hypothetical protein